MKGLFGQLLQSMSERTEKKIADLKSVETWLTLNLNMLRLSIQGLEMQKNTLAAMQGATTQADNAASAGAPTTPASNSSPINPSSAAVSM